MIQHFQRVWYWLYKYSPHLALDINRCRRTLMGNPVLWATSHWSSSLENFLWRSSERVFLDQTDVPSAAAEKQLCWDIASVPNYSSWLFLLYLLALSTAFLSLFYSYPSHQDLTVWHCLFIFLPLALAKLFFLKMFMGDPGELVGNRPSYSCITCQSFLGTFWEWLALLKVLFLLSHLLCFWPLDPLLLSSLDAIIHS